MLQNKVQQAITKAYTTLSIPQRKVWDLVMKQGMSQYDAAKRLKITRNAVDRRLYWARRKYREMLKGFTNS